MESNLSEAKIKKEVIINLNSLSNDNFKKISIKIIKLIDIISTTYDKNFSIFINIFFNKAINNSEEIFISLYTDLISKILKHLLLNNEEDFKIFYRSIINKCQNIFEEDITDENHEIIEGSTLLIGSFINKNIIKRELVAMIIKTMVKENTTQRVNIMIKLVNSFDSHIIIDLNTKDFIKSLKQSYNSNSRIYLLLEDISERYNIR
jgi:hypothetical protein